MTQGTNGKKPSPKNIQFHLDAKTYDRYKMELLRSKVSGQKLLEDLIKGWLHDRTMLRSAARTDAIRIGRLHGGHG